MQLKDHLLYRCYYSSYKHKTSAAAAGKLEPGTLCLQLAGIFVPCAFCCFCCPGTEKLSSSYLVTSLCLDLLFFPVLHSLFFRLSVTGRLLLLPWQIPLLTVYPLFPDGVNCHTPLTILWYQNGLGTMWIPNLDRECTETKTTIPWRSSL